MARKILEDVHCPDGDKAQKSIDELSSQVGKDLFVVLLQDVEPRATQIVEQTLRSGTG